MAIQKVFYEIHAHIVSYVLFFATIWEFVLERELL